MKHKTLILMALPLLSSCMAQSSIQRDYMRQQDVCRSDVAKLLSTRQGDASEAAAQAAAGVRFSECMNTSGWRVSIPKTAPGTVAQGPAPNPPTGSPSTNPSAAAVPPPAQASGGVSPSEGTAAIYRGIHAASPATVPQTTPVQVMQPVAQSAPQAPAGAPVANGPVPARYQPARPAGTAEVPYGSGGGRRF